MATIHATTADDQLKRQISHTKDLVSDQRDIGFSFAAYQATYRKRERERINRESRISAQPDWRDGVIAGMLKQALKREVRHA